LLEGVRHQRPGDDIVDCVENLDHAAIYRARVELVPDHGAPREAAARLTADVSAGCLLDVVYKTEYNSILLNVNFARRRDSEA
jgi:hypothetical protein